MLLGLLLTLQLIVSLGLIVVVLLQRSEGGVLGQGGGPSNFMTARGAGDLMTRTTWILGTAFFVISLLLTILAGRDRGGSSVVDRLSVDSLPAAPAPAQLPGQAPAPAAPGPIQAPTPTVNNPFLSSQPPAQPAPGSASAPAQQ